MRKLGGYSFGCAPRVSYDDTLLRRTLKKGFSDVPCWKFQKGYARNPPERSSGEICARDGRKVRRTFGENICRFSSFNFQAKWPQDISRTILDTFHSAPNEVLSLLKLWEVGARRRVLRRVIVVGFEKKNGFSEGFWEGGGVVHG